MARPKRYPDVHAAIKAGDEAALRRAFDAADDAKRAANAQNDDGWTPIEYAFEQDQVRLLRAIVDVGGDLHASRLYAGLGMSARTRDAGRVTALLAVEPADKWSDRERIEAIEAAADANSRELLDALPLPTSAGALAKTARRAAMIGHGKTLAWCLDRGLDVNDAFTANGETSTLLHEAAEAAQAATTALLIEHGATLDARDHRGRTPLMRATKEEPRHVSNRPGEREKLAMAFEEGRVIYAAAPADAPAAGTPDTAFATLLAAGADATLTDDAGLDAAAILDGEYGRTLKKLDLTPADPPDLATLAAQAQSRVPIVLSRLYWNDDETSSEDQEQFFAAEDAALAILLTGFKHALDAAGAIGRRAADDAVVKAMKARDLDALRRALADGGSPDAAILVGNGYSSQTPLASAAGRGEVETCRVLLDAGANPDDGGDDGPPIIRAAGSGKADIVRLLLDRGADATLDDPHVEHHTAIDSARFGGQYDIVDLLLASGVPEPEANEPFVPGASFMNSGQDLVIRADAARVAEAIAKHINGQAHIDVLGERVFYADTCGYVVVQFDGCEWTNVEPHVGTLSYDHDWDGLAAVLSRVGRAVFVDYEDTAGVHRYRIFEGGRTVETFTEEVDPEEFGENGDWMTTLGTPKPERMDRGHETLDALANRENFVALQQWPAIGEGTTFEMRLAGNRWKLAAVHYVAR